MMRNLALALLLCACGGGGDAAGDAGDANSEVQYGHKPIDAGTQGFDAAEEEAGPPTPDDRMTPHDGIVLSSVALRVIYVADGVNAPKNFDTLLAWMVQATDYWYVLAQYGVGYGTVIDSTTLDASTFFQAGDMSGGLIPYGVLNERIRSAILALPAPDAGATANAYIVFLPGGVNVDLGTGDTCSWALGYHSYDGVEPYAVIPACGAFDVTVSHEMAEMSSDPVPFGGWYSEADEEPAGGEVGDLCNFPVSVEGHSLSGLWSNNDGVCEPQ